jgi:hypothetical protein
MRDWTEEAAHQVLEEMTESRLDRAQEAAEAAEKAQDQNNS